jgi:hypothetical protein
MVKRNAAVDDAVLEAYNFLPKTKEGWAKTSDVQKYVMDKYPVAKLTVYYHIFGSEIWERVHGSMRLKHAPLLIEEGEESSLSTPEEIKAHFQERNQILDQVVDFLSTIPMGIDSEEARLKVELARDELRDGIEETFNELLRFMRDKYAWKYKETY